MRIFNVNYRFNGSSRSFDSCNVNLTSSEVTVILESLNKLKDEVAQGIVSQFKSLF